MLRTKRFPKQLGSRMTASNRFAFADDPIVLPKGAWASTERRMLRIDGKPLLALTQGGKRAYVFPLYTPSGFAVTSEAPADHPHHNSFWIASDHVHCMMPAADERFEEYTYNFYVNDTFQGRAPGRIVMTGATGGPTGDDSYRLVQSLEWRGPVEWAAPDGRIAATETRTLDIDATPEHYVIDVTSRLAAAEWDLHIGPTRHSYFNVRVAEFDRGDLRRPAGRRQRPRQWRGGHRQRCEMDRLFGTGRRRPLGGRRRLPQSRRPRRYHMVRHRLGGGHRRPFPQRAARDTAWRIDDAPLPGDRP